MKVRMGAEVWRGAVQVTQEFRCKWEQRNRISHTKWVKKNLFPFKTRKMMTFFHVDGNNSVEENLI